MRIIKYWILALLLVPFGAQALTVNMWTEPQDSGPLTIGDTTAVEIWGSWDAPVAGGVFNLAFDDSVINAVSSTVVIPVGMPGMSDNGMPATGGVLTGFGFTTFGSYAADTDTHIATVVFEAVGGGVSPLVLTPTKADGFFLWEDLSVFPSEQFWDAPPPNFTQAGSVAVVPLPAAAWFMLSGLGFLAFRRRRAA